MLTKIYVGGDNGAYFYIIPYHNGSKRIVAQSLYWVDQIGRDSHGNAITSMLCQSVEDARLFFSRFDINVVSEAYQAAVSQNCEE